MSRRRLVLGAGLLTAAVVALALTSDDEGAAGYGVTRLHSGVAVAADPSSNSPPAGGDAIGAGPARAPAAEAIDGMVSSTAVPGGAGSGSSDGPRGGRRSGSGPSVGAEPRSAPAPPIPQPVPRPGRPGQPQPVDPCSAPPPGAVPPGTATAQVAAPPRQGAYAYLVQPAGAAGPRPDPDRWVVTHKAPTRWTLDAPLADGWSTSSTLQLTGSGIELLSWTLTSPAGSTSVRPLRPVTELALPASADTPPWMSIGYDLNAGVAIAVQGRYVERQAVPLCGSLVDAWKVESTFTVTPLPLASQGAPTITITGTRWVATQHGALLARAAQRVEARQGPHRLDLNATWYLRELNPR